MIGLVNQYWKKLDEHNDEKFEKDLRSKIQYMADLLSIEKDLTKRMEHTKTIISLYDDLRINGLNYTSEDEKEKKQYLKMADDIVSYRYDKLKKDEIYKELMERAKNEQDDSWDDYENEEKYLDKEDEEEER